MSDSFFRFMIYLDPAFYFLDLVSILTNIPVVSRSNTMSTTGRLPSRGNSLYLPGDIAAYVAGEVGVGSASPTALTFGDERLSVDELGVRTNPQHAGSSGSGSGNGSDGTGSSWYTASSGGGGTGA